MLSHQSECRESTRNDETDSSLGFTNKLKRNRKIPFPRGQFASIPEWDSKKNHMQMTISRKRSESTWFPNQLCHSERSLHYSPLCPLDGGEESGSLRVHISHGCLLEQRIELELVVVRRLQGSWKEDIDYGKSEFRFLAGVLKRNPWVTVVRIIERFYGNICATIGLMSDFISIIDTWNICPKRASISVARPMLRCISLEFANSPSDQSKRASVQNEERISYRSWAASEWCQRRLGTWPPFLEYGRLR